MRIYVWLFLIALTAGIGSYTVGLNSGYEVGYNTAMADAVLGLVTPEQHVKGLMNGTSNGNNRAAR